MAYPSFDQLYGGRKTPEQDIGVDVSDYGAVSTRTGSGSKDPAQFEVIHHLTAAQLATLNAAYLSHVQAVPIVAESFTWQEDNTSHSVFYAGPPQAEWLGPDLYRARVVLRRVIDFGSLALESGDILLLESGDELLTEGA